ncbi:MAG: hypothetical protein HOQ05_06750 [Corynebacteriales bacterium]|nr:hypothetical protein [Mycobacteriales bacterium]
MESSPNTGLSGRLGDRVDQPKFNRLAVPPFAALTAAALTILQPLLARIFGIAAWSGSFTQKPEGTWHIGLTMMVWYTAVAVMGGALLARHITQRTSVRCAEFCKAALWAAAGALFAFPVIAALASGADVPHVTWPGLSMAASVPIGAVLGVAATWLAIHYSAVRIGVGISVAWVWLLGFVSVVMSWGDDVRQSVPLGAATVGGPPKDAAPIDHTLHESTVSILKMVSIAGPILIACALLWWARQNARSVSEAITAGLAGPLFILASYLVRPNALDGANLDWFQFSLRIVGLALLAAAATWVIAVVWWSRKLSSEGPSPLLNIKIAEKR